jgi:glycosyltransferase involved in cell wall biosynthesis
MNKTKPKVLMELRPCFEHFAGIPQETRLLFRSLSVMDNIETTGLINHPIRMLERGLRRNLFGRWPTPHQEAFKLSRVALSTIEDPLAKYFYMVYRYVEKRFQTNLIRLEAAMGKHVRVYDFKPDDFGDFLWQSLFSKTLPASDYELIRTARYASIRPSWEVLNRVATRRMQSLGKWFSPLPLVDTGNFDIFISQTPWPARVAQNTQLLVRYHDAIPIFLPHTISSGRIHQAVHMAGLMGCRRTAIFACTSNATRGDLLKIYPELEHRSAVVPDTVSHEYFEEPAKTHYIVDIIRNHICPTTEPKFLTSREKERFYDRHLIARPPRFLLIVSTLEPRKNHAKLISAWGYLKNHGMPDLKLMIVGELGWDYKRLVDSIVPAQEKGELFHLHRIPSAQLRILYREAAAVVCPSVAEGFDLSGIEAMLCGGVVVASDIPVHREIYANACEFFNPYSTMELTKALERVIDAESARRRDELVEAGLRHAPKFRSENIGPLWHDLFERIARGEFKGKSGTPNPPRLLDPASSQVNGPLQEEVEEDIPCVYSSEETR